MRVTVPSSPVEHKHINTRKKGQYARVIGFVEPLEEEEIKKGVEFVFENNVIGTNIPPEFIPSCEKGAKAACEKGVLAGYSLFGVRVVITDGAAHAVDSNDLSFQLAMQYGIRQGVKGGGKCVFLNKTLA